MAGLFGKSFLTLGNPEKEMNSLETGLSAMVDPLINGGEEDDDSYWKIDPEKEKYKPKGPPKRCPNWLNILCIVFAVVLTIVAVGVFLGYYYGFRDPDEGFTKETVYWVVGLACAILGSMCCLSFGVYCLVCRARCWWDRKQKKRAKEQARDLAGLKKRRRERFEQNTEVRGKHQHIRDKYGLKKSPLDDRL